MNYDNYIELVQKFNNMKPRDIHVERMLDRIVGRAEYTKLDSQGRITLSKSLRQSVQIKDNVQVVGKFDHFELWSTELRDSDEAGLQNNKEFNKSRDIVLQRDAD